VRDAKKNTLQELLDMMWVHQKATFVETLDDVLKIRGIHQPTANVAHVSYTLGILVGNNRITTCT
jgi:hypothetical protein